MINIVVCGYRTWAMEIINGISKNEKINIYSYFSSKEEYEVGIKQLPSNIDFILFLGWSWIITTDILEKYLCIGIHPSDLPMFRGGSPIQHQIIEGIRSTKLTLMSLSDDGIDMGDIWGKEELDLSGNNMDEIFKHIAASSIILLNKFINEFPNVIPTKQNISEGSFYKRRTPKESKIKREYFLDKSLFQLYNFIRALTDPYPNAYIEDEQGNKLVFKQVEYIEAEKITDK